VTGLSFEDLKAGSRACPHLLVSSIDLFSKNGRLVKLRLRSKFTLWGCRKSGDQAAKISIIDAGRPSLRQLQCLFFHDKKV
jgi:hypothetical protein